MNEPNWVNQTVWTGDNLPIMRGMNSDCVDLICLDPPFNSDANYAAPIGSEAAGAEFKDTWSLTDIDAEWINLIEDREPRLFRVLLAAMTDSDKSYLVYMAVRLLEMRRILKPTGSIYLHCDPTMSHYLKLLMDAIWGRGNFRNEVIWHYGKWTNAAKHFQKNHDILLVYAKNAGEHTFNKLYNDEESYHYEKGWHTNTIEDGISQLIVYDKKKAKEKIESGIYDNIVYREGETKAAMPDVWKISVINPMADERIGYPTQKPLELYKRIIAASSNDGDMVLDPFCGCATTCIAAEKLERQWCGIDISGKAIELTKLRLQKEVGIFSNPIHRTDIPQRTDLGKIPPYNSAENRRFLYGAQSGNCAGCKEHFEARHLEVDHIIARSNGGTDHIENLQLLCASCNRIKGDRGMEYLRSKLQLII